jgi:hypothetical protein
MRKPFALLTLCCIVSAFAAGQAGAQDRVWRDEERVARDDYRVYRDQRDIARDRRALSRDYREERYYGWRERQAARSGNYSAAEYYRQRRLREDREIRAERRDIARDRQELARDRYRRDAGRAKLRYDEGRY